MNYDKWGKGPGPPHPPTTPPPPAPLENIKFYHSVKWPKLGFEPCIHPPPPQQKILDMLWTILYVLLEQTASFVYVSGSEVKDIGYNTARCIL